MQGDFHIGARNDAVEWGLDEAAVVVGMFNYTRSGSGGAYRFAAAAESGTRRCCLERSVSFWSPNPSTSPPRNDDFATLESGHRRLRENVKGRFYNGYKIWELHFSTGRLRLFGWFECNVRMEPIEGHKEIIAGKIEGYIIKDELILGIT